ncbi:MAG: hypothetical protein AAF614_14425 [Chloroflexota bacterium]
MRRLLILLNIMVLLVVLIVAGYVAAVLTLDTSMLQVPTPVQKPVALPTTAVPATVEDETNPPLVVNGPMLTIPSLIIDPAKGTAQVPINFAAAGNEITSLLFSLDYDQAALLFDGQDGNGDGVPEAIQLQLPADFTAIVSFSAVDSDGEIDIAIFDAEPPFSPLPDSNLLYVTFATQTAAVSEIAFSAGPSPSFGDIFGQRVLGGSHGGWICVGQEGCEGAEPLPETDDSVREEAGGVAVAQALAEPTIEPTVAPTAVPTVIAPTPATAVPVCENLLIDGNLEASNGWEIDQTAYTASYESTLVHAGRQALRLGIPSATNNARSFSAVRQTVQLPADLTSATLSYWQYAFGNTRADEGDYLYIQILQPSGEQRPLDQQPIQNQSWQQQTFDLTAHAGQTIVLQFGAFNDGAGGSLGMYLDDIELEVCR